MIQHFLNNTEVFPKKDTSIKVTKENPILTDSGSYTYDVNFPLSIAENRKFFGPLDRIDVKKKWVTYDIVVKNNGVTLLMGTAHVTKVSKDCVTLQYLGGNSNIRFWNNADEQYIDEYDYNMMNLFGHKYDIVSDLEDSPWYVGICSTAEIGHDLKYGNDDATETTEYFTFIRLTMDNYQDFIGRSHFLGMERVFTFARVCDSNFSSKQIKKSAFGNGFNFKVVTETVPNTVGIREPERNDSIQLYCNCVQPNLLWIVGRICWMRGYTLDSSIFDGTPVQDIYIASAHQSLKMADALPHWTVKDFITQFQNLLNVTIVFDDRTSKAVLTKNEDIENAELKEIKEVTDDIDIELSEEDQVETLDNVKYDDWDDTYKILAPEEVREKTHIALASSTYAGVNTEIELIDDEYEKRDSIFVTPEGRRYVYNPNGEEGERAVEIDYFGPISTDYENATELKIHPAKLIQKEFRDGYVERTTTQYWSGTDPKCDRLSIWEHYHTECVMEMENQWGGYTKEGESIYEKLEAGEDVTQREKDDYMHIFFMSQTDKSYEVETRCHLTEYKVETGTRIYDPTDNPVTDEDVTSTTTWYIPISDPHIEKEYLAGRNKDYRVDASMRLKPGSEASWYLGTRFETKVGYDTKIIHQFNFVSRTVPNIRSKFLIRGKKYACQKIEYNIEDDGINPLMTGYFIKIES